MNDYLYIKIKNKRASDVIIKMRQIGVALYEIKEENNDVFLKINSIDYEKIEKYLKTYKIKKIRYTGKKYIYLSLKRYFIIYLFMLLSVATVVLASFFIVDIKVIHEDEKLVDIILEELAQRGVKKFSFQKSYNTLSKIKKDIKNSHLDLIDWLEIEKKGMKYVVRIEKRVIANIPKEEEYCHVYATKDAIVKKIEVKEGESKVFLNDYVKKGDLLISGDITLNENTVNKVCASGKVYAESWYTVNVKVPIEYKVSNKTGKKRNNIVINYDNRDYVILNDRLKEYESVNKLLFEAFGIKFYQRIDEEKTSIIKKYTTDEAVSKGIEEAKEKVENTLNEGDKIISQKVLQKTINDSTIDIDVFIITQENIAKREIERESDGNDS